MRSTLLVVLAVVASPLAVRTARACGGLFCQNPNTPVDQNVERILFEVRPDGRITTSVEIAYTGEPSGFSWVVPVPEAPTLDVIPASSLRLLDMMTAVRIIPPRTTCSEINFPCIGCGEDSVQFSPRSAEGGVEVTQLPQAGPFSPTLVAARDPDLLISWLKNNGYLITEEMRPFVKSYVDKGWLFLAMKLAPGKGVADIQPIQWTCPADAPTIPLVLTAVAAEPEMGIQVFLAGDFRFEAANWANVKIETEQVRFDVRTQQSNYPALVSLLMDQVGGRGFVTQFAGASAPLRGTVGNFFINTPDAESSTRYVDELLARSGYFTRLYTRASAWEMDSDPSFRIASAGDVSNVFDLSDRPSVEFCFNDTVVAVPCGDTYCGPGSRCATTEAGVDGCMCRDGTVTRSIASPVGAWQGPVRTVTCQTAGFDMLRSMLASRTAATDPCTGVDCGGHGTCVPLGGFPTCKCNDNFAGIASGASTVPTCSRAVRSFDESQIFWGDDGESSCGCAGGAGAGWPFLAALLLLAARRRRR